MDNRALVSAIVGLHLVAFGLLVEGGALAAGVGVTAYTLGLRHALDADHLGAIDNTTRNLMADGQRPATVGFWFALGHSTIVLAVAALLAAGVRVTGAGVGGTIGPLVSGAFLVVIGLLNLRLLVQALHGEGLAAPGGVMTRVYARATRAIRAPWQMYPLGLLFGLGFDTATEITLLATAAGAAAGGLPVASVLCLPLLFAAGMTLLDTLDGVVMRAAYGWAITAPGRKLNFNVAITGLSVFVALFVGTTELINLQAG